MAFPHTDSASADRIPVGFGPCPCAGAAADRAWSGPLGACFDWQAVSLAGEADAAWLAERTDLCGYVFTSTVFTGAPCDCALAARLKPAPLPVAAATELDDPAQLASFAVRVFVYRRWRQFRAAGLDRHGLQAFHASHKYLVMSRHVPSYRALGRLLAADQPVAGQAERAIELVMAALRRPATRAGQANALQHVQGYLKRKLDAAGRAELTAAIEAYRAGRAPLLTPLALLQHHFRRHPDAYIEGQVFLRPHPALLDLLDHLDPAEENATP